MLRRLMDGCKKAYEKIVRPTSVRPTADSFAKREATNEELYIREREKAKMQELKKRQTEKDVEQDKKDQSSS